MTASKVVREPPELLYVVKDPEWQDDELFWLARVTAREVLDYVAGGDKVYVYERKEVKIARVPEPTYVEPELI
jgi:hypothetical protein